MNIKKTYCLFEQSGTFKNAFKNIGYNAVDIYIKNDFGETDFRIDLFKELDEPMFYFFNLEKIKHNFIREFIL